jgi:hypothetical protein
LSNYQEVRFSAAQRHGRDASSKSSRGGRLDSIAREARYIFGDRLGYPEAPDTGGAPRFGGWTHLHSETGPVRAQDVLTTLSGCVGQTKTRQTLFTESANGEEENENA